MGSREPTIERRNDRPCRRTHFVNGLGSTDKITSLRGADTSDERVRLCRRSRQAAFQRRICRCRERKKELEDTIKELLKSIEEKFDRGVAGEIDVLQVKRVLGQATLERELFEQRAVGALPAAQLKAEVTSLDTIELVRTNLVRFGGVTVILFLASLLTPIYRYNVRLGTFYQARADTLLLSRDTNVQNFPEMIRLLTPAYGFEKEPTTPVESVASFMKEAGGLLRKG